MMSPPPSCGSSEHARSPVRYLTPELDTLECVHQRCFYGGGKCRKTPILTRALRGRVSVNLGQRGCVDRVYTGRVAICADAKPCICAAAQMSRTNETHLCGRTSRWSPGRPHIRNRRIEHPEIPDCASRFLPVLAPRPPTAPGYTAPGTATPITVSAQVSAQLQDLSGLARDFRIGRAKRTGCSADTTHR